MNEVKTVQEQEPDGAALESAGRFAEAAVAYRGELEALAEDSESASDMADLAMGIARCLEQIGNQAGAEEAKKLAASFCAWPLNNRR